MKKTKLLLPVFSVGAIAAAVVPFVTSCSDTYTLNWKDGDRLPTYDKMSGHKAEYKVEDITNDYFDQVSNELLAKEIIRDLATTWAPTNGRGDSNPIREVKLSAGLNKVYHTINFTSDVKVERSSGDKETYHVECENTEFIATRECHLVGEEFNWDIEYGRNILAPKILVYVKEAYLKKITEKEDWIASVQKALALADKLSRDTSWYFTYEEHYGESETIITKINYANIHEYTLNIFDEWEIELDPLLSLVNFAINSYYIEDINIKTEAQ